MKRIFIPVLALMAGTTLLSSCNETNKSAKMENYMDTISYAQGLVVGTQYSQYMSSPEVNGNLEIFKQAFDLGFNNDSTKFAMTREEAYEILKKHNQKLTEDAMRKKEEKIKATNALMKIKSDSAIANYKNDPNVKTTESGLMYKILKTGYGAIPTNNDIVIVHFEGKLVDGTVFTSTFNRKEPVKFPVNTDIKGWAEALKMMPVGSIWELMIPAELAYGKQGKGTIPGNAALIIKINLLGKEPAQAAK